MLLPDTSRPLRLAWVINLSTQPERWARSKAHLDDLGIECQRWPAYDERDVGDVDWKGYKVPSPEKKVAIIRSFRSLFEYLTTCGDEPWLIVQDDMEFSELPRHGTLPLTIYSENRLYRGKWEDGFFVSDYSTGGLVVDPRDTIHVHPRAFSITKEAVEQVLPLLQNESNIMCRAWAPYITYETTDVNVVARHLGVK